MVDVDEGEEVPELTDEEKAQKLFDGCKSGDVAQVQAMLDEGAVVTCRDEKGWSPLLWACFNGHDEVVALLLRHGADGDYRQTRDAALLASTEAAAAAASAAAANGQPATQEAVTRPPMNSPLHWAVYKGHTQIVWRLLLAGFSTDDVDVNGNNALHLAATRGQYDVLTAIMCAGFDMDATNGFGNDALSLCTERRCRSLLTKAVEQHQCPECRKYFGGECRMFLCEGCETFFTADCTVAQEVYAHADGSVLRPVRYCRKSLDAIQEAEAKLTQALNPRRGGDEPLEAADMQESLEYKGEEDEPAGEGRLDGTDNALDVFSQDVELKAEDLTPLEEALRAVRSIGGDVRLIASATAARERLVSQIALTSAVAELESQRPIHRRDATQPVVAAIADAEKKGVHTRFIHEAKKLVDVSIAECKLAGAIHVCQHIALATHANDGDMVKLKSSLDAGNSLGANGKLLSSASQLYRKLATEIDLFDQEQACRAKWQACLAVIEQCNAEYAAPEYQVPLDRPEPILAPDGSMVPPPTRQQAALTEVKAENDKMDALIRRAPEAGAGQSLIQTAKKFLDELTAQWQEAVTKEEERIVEEEAARVKLEKKLKKKKGGAKKK